MGRLIDADDLKLKAFADEETGEGIVYVQDIDECRTINAIPIAYGRPLSVEELKRLNGSPVWVEVIDHSVFANKEDDFNGWGLVRKSWVRIWDEKRADLITIDYDFESYGKEWLAYSFAATDESKNI